MKQLLISVFWLWTFTTLAHSQTELWNAPLDFYGGEVMVDGNDNVLVTSAGATIKYNSMGAQLWRVNKGGTVVLGHDGGSYNVYVKDGQALGKYSSAGDSLWSVNIDSSSTLSVDASGNLIVIQQRPVIVTKISPDGRVLWSSPPTEGSFYKLGIDAQNPPLLNNLYVSILTSGTGIPSFGNIRVMKINSNGFKEWENGWSLGSERTTTGGNRTADISSGWDINSFVVDRYGYSYLGGTKWKTESVSTGLKTRYVENNAWQIVKIAPNGDQRTITIKGGGRWRSATRNFVGIENRNHLTKLLSLHNGPVVAYGTIDKRKPGVGNRWENIFGMIYAIGDVTNAFLWKSAVFDKMGDGQTWGADMDPDADQYGQLYVLDFSQPPSLSLLSVNRSSGAMLRHEGDLQGWSSSYLPMYFDYAGNFYQIFSGALHKYQNFSFTFSPTTIRPPAAYEEGDYSFKLLNNYPNPFNPTTTIRFELAKDALVTVRVYNTIGQVVATLADREFYGEGENEIEFDASTLSSGVYYYQIVTGEATGRGTLFSGMKKMILVK